MATTLPSAATKANSDSSADDPKQALLTDLAGAIDKFNDLLDALGAAARLNLSGQFGTVAQSSGTPDDLRLKAPYAAKAASYTALAGDIGKVFDFTASGQTLALDPAATLGADWWCEYRNSSAGTLTLNPDAAELIDGVATKTVAAGESGKIVCTGSGFRTLSGGAGKVLQVVNTQTGATATGAGLIPADNTVPQISEGTQFMSLAITPTSATSKLKVEVVFFGQGTGNFGPMTVALFRSPVSSALAAGMDEMYDQGTHPRSISFNHFMTAGSTATLTFTVRAGMDGSGSVRFNGGGGSAYLGGVMASSITITEIAA